MWAYTDTLGQFACLFQNRFDFDTLTSFNQAVLYKQGKKISRKYQK